MTISWIGSKKLLLYLLSLMMLFFVFTGLINLVRSQGLPFHSGFETGDLSEWDMTPNPNYGGTVSVVNEYQYQANYCMKAVASGSWAWLVAQKILDPPQQLIYFRTYAKFVNIEEVGDFTKFIRIFNNETRRQTMREFIQIRPYYYKDGVGVKWGVSYWDDSLGSNRTGTPIYVDRLGSNIQMNYWHQVEVMVRVGNTSAELRLWVDNVELWNKTNFSNVLAGDFVDIIHVGLTENPTQYPDAIMYVDAVAIDTQPIGPEPGKQASSITCWIEPSSITLLQELEVFGLISPNKVDVNVTLTYNSPNGTDIDRIVRTNSSSWYMDRFSPDQLGIWNVTASWAGDETHWEAMSNTVTFSVRMYSSSMTINVYPQIMAAGEAVHVFGQIIPPVEGANVTLCYTRPDNAKVYRSVTSLSEGNYSDTYTVYYLGIWTVQASWEGDENYTGTESEIKSFTISYLDTIPPEIRNVENIPMAPEYNQITMVKAEVTDEITDVKLVILGFNSSASSWINTTMVPENVYYYVANISGFPYGTTVYYKIYASDNANNWNVSDTYSYQVADSVPPSIGTPFWEPANPSDNTDVYVNINASEPENASGLKTAFIIFQVNDGELQVFQMAYSENSWTVRIPKQSTGATVRFYIRVYDNAYNVAATPYYSYVVAGSGWNPLTPTIAMGVVIGAAAAAILVWLKVKGQILRAK